MTRTSSATRRASVCGVWVGFDAAAEPGAAGATAALPAWVRFMVDVAPRRFAAFHVPAGITMATIDPQSGGLATSACPRIAGVPFLTAPRRRRFVRCTAAS